MPATVTAPRTRAARPAGFGLIEVMIGLSVGAVALLAVLNVFETSEGYKRSITGGGDAQTSGSVALSALQRDIRQSGHGLNTPNLLGCDVALPGGITLAELAPVTINHAAIPAGDAHTDTLLIAYGATQHATEGNRILLVTGNVYTIQPPVYLIAGDHVTAGAPSVTSCSGTLTVGQVTEVAGNAITTNTSLGVVAGASLFNLGSRPRWRAYAVRDGNLTVCDFMDDNCTVSGDTGNPAVWRPVASHVVSLRAQYGRDTSTTLDGIVDTYDQTSATVSCDWARIAAIRLAVVARSHQYERDEIATDGSESNWAGQSVAPIDLSGLTDAAHYRYKRYEATIPILNIIRPGLPDGC